MTLIQSHRCLYKGQTFVVFAIALFAPTSQTFSPIDNEIDKLKKLFILKRLSAPDPISRFVFKPFTIYSTTKYLKDNLQYILKRILEVETITASTLLGRLYKKPLKAKF